MTMLKRSSSYGRRNSRRNLYSDGSEGGSGIELPHAYLDYESPPPIVYRRNPCGNSNGGGGGGGGGVSWMAYVGIMMTLLLVGGYSLVSYHDRTMMRVQLLEQETTMRELEIDLSMKFDTKLKKLQYENAALQRKLGDKKNVDIENQNLKTKIKNFKTEIEVGNERERRFEWTNNRLSKERKDLRQSIQHMSKTLQVEKYGRGPHRLEITVRFDSHLGVDDGGVIIIELAPIDDLPHATYWFLEQVTRGLFDFTSFHRNPRHIVLAGVGPSFLTTPENMPSVRKFEDAGFSSIMFQEYSNNFPHQKYTLGYAGRPGGPDFYINKLDNTLAHGPGGQKGADDPNEADTCFAKVIDGFDIVDRIGNLPVKFESSILDVAVAIISIRLKKQE